MTPEIALVAVLVLPLAGALVAVLAGTAGRWIALAVCTGIALALVPVNQGLMQDGPVVVLLGGWAPPLGIALRADGLAGVFLVLAAVVMTAVCLQGGPQFGADKGETRAGYTFWPLALLLWAALNAAFLSRDLFNLYVTLELLTLAAVALVALGRSAETIAAALRYLVFALMGSLMVLLGAALLYAGHATLDLDLLAARPDPAPRDLLAAGLVTAGLAAKTALFPFHAWLPPAHSGAPAPASALLSALVPKASFYILLRFWFEATPDLAAPALLWLLGGLGSAAVLYGSLLAMRQARLKLVIAYSTVAQIGYLFLVFPLAGGDSAAQPWAAGAWSGAMFQAVSHGLAKAAMFLCAGIWVIAAGHDRLDGLRGMAKATPMATFAFGLAAVALMGLPPSGGFTAKYLLMTAAFASGQLVWVGVLAAGGLLTAIYLYRPLAIAFSREVPENFVPVPRLLQVIPLVLAGLAVLLGSGSAIPYELMQVGRPDTAAEGLE